MQLTQRSIEDLQILPHNIEEIFPHAISNMIKKRELEETCEYKALSEKKNSIVNLFFLSYFNKKNKKNLRIHNESYKQFRLNIIKGRRHNHSQIANGQHRGIFSKIQITIDHFKKCIDSQRKQQNELDTQLVNL